MKRLFDVAIASFCLIGFSPVLLVIALAILISEGRPILYVSERMKTPNQPFTLFKFRTMRTAAEDDENKGVSGGDKTKRITRIGAPLRRFRLDELPQLVNILRGDMSFVGPRPPLRQYTEKFPSLHHRILKHRPGITGFATLYFHKHEERLIATATTPQETERIYVTRCIPRKARLDLIYAKHASPWLDLCILGQTLKHILLRG